MNLRKKFAVFAHRKLINYLLLEVMLLTAACSTDKGWKFDDSGDRYTVSNSSYRLVIQKENARLSLQSGEHLIPAAEPSGFYFSGSYAVRCSDPVKNSDSVVFTLINKTGKKASLTIIPSDEYVKLRFTASSGKDDEDKIFISTGGVSPAFGMGEHAGYPMHPYSPASTEITGFSSDSVIASVGNHFVGRMISNFVIFPKSRLAEVNIDPMLKICRFTKEENTQGSWDGRMRAMYYFFGDPETIYRNYLKVRNVEGYPVMKPKYAMFGLGWEAWGALAWKTNQETVTSYVSEYLKRDYPLQWVVIGSGFWPKTDSSYMATTSFGMWDKKLYPDPKAMIDYFHENDLKVLIGLRIGFLKNGPYTEEGIENGYFLKKNGQAKIIKVGFPKGQVYLLDDDNPAAVDWYVNLCKKWLDDGIDGFKEDLFGYHWNVLSDAKVNHVNEKLMEMGVYIIGRNNYLGSAMDIQRIEDFNYNMQLDRGPISALEFAYSGFPFVYPDVVGGAPYYSDAQKRAPGFQMYLARFAWFASLNPSMGLGMGPWTLGNDTINRIIKKAALFHDRIHPYIYSEAIRTVKTGFPYTLTPLVLKYPEEPLVYHREDTIHRGFQWLIGESLLAAPLFGNDSRVATTRDIFIPEGNWMDLETGKVFNGPKIVKNRKIPAATIPAYVGGKGMLLFREGATINASVFPVSRTGTSETFYFPDGVSQCTITNHIDDWDAKIRVLEGDDREQEYMIDPVTYAVSFPVLPGEKYTLENEKR